MKKLLVVTTLAIALTVGSSVKTIAQENTTLQISENKDLIESEFKIILNDPVNYFDFKVSDAKYVVKNTDTEYLLLAATSEEAKGLYNVKAFAYDRANNKVVELDDEFVVGDSSTSWLKGALEEYSNNSNKLRYTVKSESVDKFEIKDIVFENNGITDETVKEGSLSKDKLPSANVKELSWKNLELKKEVSDRSQSSTSTSSNSSDNSNKTISKNEGITQKQEQTTKQEVVIERKSPGNKSKLDINAIAKGDLSSLAGGVYSETFVKSDNKNFGMVNRDFTLGVDSIKKEGNVAIIESRITDKAPLMEGGGEVPVDRASVYHYVVPAGEKSPVEVENDDITRDRVITQIHANKEVSYLDNNK